MRPKRTQFLCLTLLLSIQSTVLNAEDARPPSSEELAAVRKNILVQLPSTASISAADYQRIATAKVKPTLTEMENQSLSLILLMMTLHPIHVDGIPLTAKAELEFEGTEIPLYYHLGDEMFLFSTRFGSGTILRSHRLSDFTCKLDGDTARGAVSFRIRYMVRGRVNWVAKKVDNKWTITEFHFPNWDVHTVLKQGKWKASGAGLFPPVQVQHHTTAGALLQREPNVNRVAFFVALEKAQKQNSPEQALRISLNNRLVPIEQLKQELKKSFQAVSQPKKPPVLVLHLDRALTTGSLKSILEIGRNVGFNEVRLVLRSSNGSAEARYGELSLQVGLPPKNVKLGDIQIPDIRVILKVSPSGKDTQLIFGRRKMGQADAKSFAQLNDETLKIIGRPGNPLTKEITVVFETDDTIPIGLLAEAISACTGKREAASDEVVKYFHRFKLAEFSEEEFEQFEELEDPEELMIPPEP